MLSKSSHRWCNWVEKEPCPVCLGSGSRGRMEVESQLPYFVLKFTCPRGSLKIALLKFKLLSHIPQSGKVLACWAVCSMWHETETRTRSFYGKGGKNCPSLLLPVYHKAYHLLRNYNSSILKQEEALAI